MRKKIVIIIICTSIIVTTSLGSGFVGYKLNSHSPKVMSEIIQANRSQVVAVVNLDEGVQQDGEVINYSTSLVDLGSERFATASLTEAQTGVENGTYMAYVVIPATFSEKAVSLNTDPQKSEIQYEISNTLDEDTKESAMHEIFNLQKDLNDSLGYMYISAILGEFRNAQGDAQTILENDKVDLDVLLNVNDYDLVSIVNIGDLKIYDKELEQSDLTEEFKSNNSYIQSIEDKYKTYLAEGGEDLTTIQTDSNTILEDSSVLDNLKSMGNFKDEDATSVYAKGQEEVATTLSGYNSSLKSGKKQIKISATQTIAGLQLEANNQLKAIWGLSDGSATPDSTSINGNFANFKNIIKSEVTNHVQQTISSLNITDATQAFSTEAQTDYKNKINSNVVTGISNASIGTSIAEYATMKNELNLYSRVISYLNTFTIDNLLVETTADPNHELNQLARSVTGDAMDFAQYVASGSIDSVGTRHQEETVKAEIGALVSPLILQDDDEMSQALQINLNASGQATILAAVNQSTADSLFAFFTDRIDPLDSTYDAYLLSSKNAEITFDNENSLELKKALEEQVDTVGSVDKDEIAILVNNKIIDPMKTITQSEKNNAILSEEAQKTKAVSLNTLITQYDPISYIKTEELTTVYSDINNINTKISEKVTKNATNCMEFASKTNELALENLTNIVEKIQTENEKANTKITESLQGAKQSRTQINTLNKELLTEFIDKLEYTRLGKDAFSKAYQFIVNPVDFIDKSSEK